MLQVRSSLVCLETWRSVSDLSIWGSREKHRKLLSAAVMFKHRSCIMQGLMRMHTSRGRFCGGRGPDEPSLPSLRTETLDLHAGGQADGLPGTHVRVVLPCDWRDLVRDPEDPPFWAMVWPSASALAARIMNEPESVRDKHVCELGCGVGVAGFAAALSGASHVTFTDRNKYALKCVEYGIRANALDRSKYSTTALDWNDVTSVTRLVEKNRFDVLFACDILADACVIGASAKEALSRVSGVFPLLLREKGILYFAFPAESPFRPLPDVDACLHTLQDIGFSLQSDVEAQGAQLRGEGPEGLAPARRVRIAKLIFDPVANG